MAERKQRKQTVGPHRRFLEAIAATESDECIIWPFSAPGYTRVRDWRKPVPPGKHRRPLDAPYRISWELANGKDFPQGMQARHMCGNGAGGCVNPRHILPGTVAENARDRMEFGNPRFNPWNRRFSDDDIRAIREAPGLQREVAERFGLTQAKVSMIRSRKTYAHVD